MASSLSSEADIPLGTSVEEHDNFTAINIPNVHNLSSFSSGSKASSKKEPT